MKRLAVLNVVGLTKEHLGINAPNITSLAKQSHIHSIETLLPAVTCSVQSTILTGESSKTHGIIANGWHNRKTKETAFWKQSNDLVQGEKVWEALKKVEPTATIANLFWWFNMYSSVDIAVTPRPVYCDDGRKIPDIWTNPSHLRSSLQQKFGQFPLFKFWGPGAGIESSRWITQAAIDIDYEYEPTLSLIYLPHLDYCLQRIGPEHHSIKKEVKAIDNEVGKLIKHFETQNVAVCILSEYGIETANNAIAINRTLRSNGLLSIREELGKEYLDPGQSDAFAVPDHQIAHVYVKNSDLIESVAECISSMVGVDQVMIGHGRDELDHHRSGDIIAVAEQHNWFSHDWWNDDSMAPDYQRTVDIHSKPGYDPRELHLEDGWQGSKVRIALKLLMKKIGFRTAMDVITINPERVKGTHGRTPSMGAPSPILIPPRCAKEMPQSLPAAALKSLFIEWITS